MLVWIGVTDVEWPKEKNIPTVTGRCPAAIKRRVMRSIACHLNIKFLLSGRIGFPRTDIWSASKACLKPRIYAKTAVPTNGL